MTEALKSPAVRAVITPSFFNAERVRGVIGSGKPIHVIRSAIDFELFCHRSHRNAFRSNSCEETPIVLWVGRLESQKNPEAFVALARELLRWRENLCFWAIGDAPRHDPGYRPWLCSRVPQDVRKKLRLSLTIDYADMPYVYSMVADSGGCLLSTSLNESLPMTMLEAMACECPVVASAVGGVPELIDSGQTGWLYQPRDGQSALATIKTALGEIDGTRRQRIVAAALSRVRAEHAMERIGQQYAAVLASLD
jgi:glycosyltransferase involved in cell wall biosynthesis